MFSIATAKTFKFEQKEQLNIFKRHGIDGFFTVYEKDSQILELKEHADRIGLFFQSIHAPYLPMRDLWHDSENGQVLVDKINECIRCASKVGVKKVISHLFSTYDMEHPTKMGMQRVEQILEQAQKSGVNICFENLQGAEYLDAVLTEYAKYPFVKLCYDTGHEHCYHNYDVVEKHHKKIGAVHLNDNLGLRNLDGSFDRADDLHLLVFDGNVNFDRACDLLISANFTDELTFEFKITQFPESKKYEKMDFDSYMDLAVQRMQMIRTLIDKKLNK